MNTFHIFYKETVKCRNYNLYILTSPIKGNNRTLFYERRIKWAISYWGFYMWCKLIVDRAIQYKEITCTEW